MMEVWFFVFTLAVLGGATIYSVWRYFHNNSQPEISARVKITKINTRQSGDYVWNGGSLARNLTPKYIITFSFFLEEKSKKLFVPVYGNEHLAVGDTGLLTYQGTRFIRFEREEKYG